MIAPSDVRRMAAEIISKAPYISFLSEVELSDEDLQVIKNNVITIIDRALVAYEFDSVNDWCIVASYYLVEIGRKHYSASGFWPKVEENYGRLNNKSSEIFKMFKQTLNELGMTVDYTPRNVEAILVHSFVPDEFLNDFYEFIFKYYRNVLHYTVPEDEEELDMEFELLEVYFKNILEEKEQGPELERFPMTHGLVKCTVYALSDKNRFKGLMGKVLRTMDKEFRNADEEVDASRFDESIKEWISKALESGRYGKRTYYGSTPHLILGRNNGVQIEFPKIIDPISENITIKFNGRKAKGCPRIRTLPSGKKVMESYYLPLSDIGADSFSGLEINFNGRSRKIRNNGKYLLFDEDRNHVNEVSLGDNFILPAQGVEIVEKNCPVYVIDRNSKLSSVRLDEGDYVEVNGELLSPKIGEEEKSNIVPTLINHCSAKNTEGEKFPIIIDRTVSFVVGSESLNPLILVRIRSSDEVWNYPIDEVKRIGENRFEFKKKVLPEDIGLFKMELHVDDRKEAEAELFSIPEYGFKFDKNYYIHDKEGRIYFSGIDMEPLDFGTDEETVDWLHDEYVISHTVPALSVDIGGGRRLYPGECNITLDEFKGDRLKFRLPTAEKMTIIPRIGGKALYTVTEDVRMTGEVDILVPEFRRDRSWSYTVDLSYNSNERSTVLDIRTHDEYSIDKSGEFLKIEKHGLLKIFAECFYIVNGKEHSEPLQDGCNVIRTNPLMVEKIIIKEFEYEFDESEYEVLSEEYPISYEESDKTTVRFKDRDFRFLNMELTNPKPVIDKELRFTSWNKEDMNILTDYIKKLNSDMVRSRK